MTHDELCPRQMGWWQRCRCDLILEVRSSQRQRDRSPDTAEHDLFFRKWYWSGRQDAAEEIESLMHQTACMCDRCNTLMEAYHAAHGNHRRDK